MRKSGIIILIALALVVACLEPTAAQQGCTKCDGPPCNGAVCFNGPFDRSKCEAIGCGMDASGYAVFCDQANGNPCQVIDPSPTPTPIPSLTEKPVPVASSPALAVLLLVFVALSVRTIRRKT